MHKYVLSLLAIFLLGSFAIYPRGEVIDPQIKAQQELQKKRAEESGYADIEIDLLHKGIVKHLPVILKSTYMPNRDEVIQEDGPKVMVTLPVASGESIKSISQRYIYDGWIVMETNKEGTALTEIRLIFERTNPFGSNYKKEKRELINGSPAWDENGKKIDGNDDMELIYSETPDDESKAIEGAREFKVSLDDEFIEIERLKIKEISVEFFDKKMKLVQTYKKYLRRTEKMLQRQVRDLLLKERVRVQHLLELQ